MRPGSLVLDAGGDTASGRRCSSTVSRSASSRRPSSRPSWHGLLFPLRDRAGWAPDELSIRGRV